MFVNFPHGITEICRNIPDKFLMPLPPIIHNIISFFLGILLIFSSKDSSQCFLTIRLLTHAVGEKNPALQLIGSSPCIFKKGCKMVKLAFKKSSRRLFNCFSKLHFPAHSLSLSCSLSLALSLISSYFFPCKAEERGSGREDVGQAVLTSATAKETFTVAINELFWKLFL